MLAMRDRDHCSLLGVAALGKGCFITVLDVLNEEFKGEEVLSCFICLSGSDTAAVNFGVENRPQKRGQETRSSRCIFLIFFL